MSIEDERVQFYFRHRVQIEEWAALRTEAAAAVDDWMTQLGPHCDELARSLGPDVRLRAHIGAEQAYPSFRLRHAAWGFDGTEDEPACIALEWIRRQTTMRGNLAPCVGVRSPKTTTIGAALRAGSAFQQTFRARVDQTNAVYAGYRFVRPLADFPISADAYRSVLIEALRDAWNAYAPLVTNSGGAGST